MKFILVGVYILVSVLSLSKVLGQNQWNFEQLESTRIYAIGDMHLDQIKLRSRENFHNALVDSGSSYEYQLLSYLVKERNARYIFIELPVNFQLYIDLYFESGEYGELLKCFSRTDRQILKKLDYLRLIRSQFPDLKVLCSEAGVVDQNLFYSTNLFYQISSQVFKVDTVSLVVEWNAELFTALYEHYNAQIDSLFALNNDVLLHSLMKKLIRTRFVGSSRPEEDLLDLSKDWLNYLRYDPDANKYFTNNKHIVEIIEWYMIGAQYGRRNLEKHRDSLITKYVTLKIENDSAAAVLLFGGIHVSPAWSHSKNVYHTFEKQGWKPVAIEMCYKNYPYYFHPKDWKRRVRTHKSANEIIKFQQRSWGLKVG